MFERTASSPSVAAPRNPFAKPAPHHLITASPSPCLNLTSDELIGVDRLEVLKRDIGHPMYVMLTAISLLRMRREVISQTLTRKASGSHRHDRPIISDQLTRPPTSKINWTGTRAKHISQAIV
ncbi:unnamed protein product [Urochloa humidicola]